MIMEESIEKIVRAHAKESLQGHPIASLFEMMTPEEMRILANDIKENGLQEDIWLYEDMILDGRNRHIACKLAGVEPRFREYTGNSPVQFVISRNLHRRHLSAGQRAILAVRVKPMLEEEAKKRQSEAGKERAEKAERSEEGFYIQDRQRIDEAGDTRNYEKEDGNRSLTQAAKLTGTNRQYVHDIEKIGEESPELVEEINKGKMTIPQAKNELKRRERAQGREEIEGLYDVIYADYKDNKVTINDLKEMAANVRNISNKDCALFFWCPSPNLDDVLSVIKLWGFQYRSLFVCVRQSQQGKYNSISQDLLLLCGKGNITPSDTKVNSIQALNRDTAVSIIRQMYPEKAIIRLSEAYSQPDEDSIVEADETPSNWNITSDRVYDNL